jgi:hypothetical protein
MNVGIIIVTMGKWDEYVIPYLKSIRKYDDESWVMVVNNSGSDIPAYGHERTYAFDLRIGQEHALNETVSYASAINDGLFGLTWFENHKDVEFDWVVISNDDVLVEGEFRERLCSLDKRSLYGANMHYHSKLFTDHPCPWLDGWIYYVPYSLILDVGEWDKEFLVAGFEDADYCFRAYKKDYVIRLIDLPFKHLEAHTRKEIDHYSEKRLWNAHYLVMKHGLTEIRELPPGS